MSKKYPVILGVALRKESLDRKLANPGSTELILPVALRKESVDRKLYRTLALGGLGGSLSARRAWIENRCNPT